MRDPKLWERIVASHPDAIDAELPFSKRLARENGWSQDFADKVMYEYLKFAYLSRISDSQVTPSDEVDQAWHLHLTYTKHYWGDFKIALGSSLHHMPTKGGDAQQQHFRETYSHTLRLYEAEFGQPSADFWPPIDTRFGKASSFVRVSKQDVWILPKPNFALSRISEFLIKFKKLVAITLALILAGLGTQLALAHGEPEGDTFFEKAHSMLWHWALEHTFEFVLGVLVITWVLFYLLKGTRNSNGCSSGCASGGGDSSGCAGCGGD